MIKNLLNSEDKSDVYKAKNLSSLITHILIEMESNEDLVYTNFFELCRIENILSAIISYAAVKNSDLINKEIDIIKAQVLEMEQVIEDYEVVESEVDN